jgi:glycosyltransferase involved in cell wall biosynthesis
MEKSSHVIAVSEHTRRDLIDVYDLDPHAIRVIYPGVSQQMQKPNSVDVQKTILKYRLPQRFLLFVGTMEPRKNISSVIEAFSAIAGHVSQDLVIAGERGWKEKELLHAIESSLHADRIHRIGFIEEADKQALYAAADLFVYPSFYEGFGFPPLEALLAGTPAVVSFNSSLPEVVGDWATLVDPYNTPEIAATLKELLVAPQRVPDRIQKEIREKYSWERAAQQTIEILESVV